MRGSYPRRNHRRHPKPRPPRKN